jgi:hypothetical protein
MPVINEKGCRWIISSKYYKQSPASLPFAPHMYWNVVTDRDIIPVCTWGYKDEKSARKQINTYIYGVKEIRLLYVQSKEDHHKEFLMHIRSFSIPSQSNMI